MKLATTSAIIDQWLPAMTSLDSREELKRDTTRTKTLQFQWRVFWEREGEAGGEVGKTMVSRSELRCGEDDDIELS
ncbi:hypothetical protein Bca52824_082553 [Brassica carinata]|uniref:Uncharacterized protein n=1 Tax=Brassica carinata TaxID=52824 RepID=A0A8X7PKM2_BRACI|nr:hypothetical protein Bca52824_082553 [Brassica carinata]